ncbi:hypothetical protein HJC23_013735 [Cyclotella cryptica]|uniref:Amidase domain-containing protein n=1 Tax=Cyclotella cryptica TaxID=29204 RepID=A0ABD3PIG0_9STRA|eukprot:CCRYP_014412-RA/>CCRYP_014412-RA protein AED:0.53 eAED:0.42 QI:0/-1/0/1/-1/1/1/0/678
MNLPPRMTIARAARLLQKSTPDHPQPPRLTSQQLCQHSLNLATFGENSLHLNAYAKLLPPQEILHQASASDERRKSGQAKSILDGIPVTIKANIAVGKWWEMPHACSAVLSRDTSSDVVDMDRVHVYESDVARRLLNDCGAVLIGITNMDEFGMGSLGTYNGVHDNRDGRKERRRSSPTYNPLPWMERISLLLLQTQKSRRVDLEECLLKQIWESTPLNPYGIEDECALQELLEEVSYWTLANHHNSTVEKEGNSSKECPLLSPGGSSSGAAAATAHGSSLLSIGTDTGGSLRLPAAWTCTVGFKPTYGTWSRYGVVSYASSLDTVGFIAASLECAEIAWRCLRDRPGKERVDAWDANVCRDSTARIYHTTSYTGKGIKSSERTTSTTSTIEKSIEKSDNPHKPLEGIRIGIPAAFSLYESPPLISSIWSKGAHRLQNIGGATLVTIPESKISSHWVKLSCAAYYVLACAEASSNLSRYDGVRYGADYNIDAMQYEAFFSESITDSAFSDMTELERQISATRAYGFGDEVQRRVLAGTSVLSSDRFHTHYEAAARVRAKLSQSIENIFREGEEDQDSTKVDVILIPTALSFPAVLDPRLGMGASTVHDSTAAFANDVMTIPISLGGFPSVSVPFLNNATKDEKNSTMMPHNARNAVGLQVFGPRGSEDLVLRAASILG